LLDTMGIEANMVTEFRLHGAHSVDDILIIPLTLAKIKCFQGEGISVL
jgi:hypothetical protein